MRSNHLQLNADKTEVMWCSSTRKLSQLPSCLFNIAGALVCLVNADRDLGVFIDNDLGAATHVWRTVSCCFATLRQLRHLRRYVTDDCFRSLVVSLVHSRLDYANFVLVGLPASLVIITSTACSTIPAHNRRSTHISSRCIAPLQLTAI